MIAALYKKRWAVELFFKWIKQNLRIKAFLRHFRERRENSNLDCRLRLRARRHHKIDLALDVSLYTFLQILSVHSFEKTPLAQALFDGASSSSPSTPSNQPNYSQITGPSDLLHLITLAAHFKRQLLLLRNETSPLPQPFPATGVRFRGI